MLLLLFSFPIPFFLQNVETNYNDVVSKAIDHIINALDGQNDIYSLAVAAYALQLAEHQSKDKILAQLIAKASTKSLYTCTKCGLSL